jgi:hypothetical protein
MDRMQNGAQMLYGCEKNTVYNDEKNYELRIKNYELKITNYV